MILDDDATVETLLDTHLGGGGRIELLLESNGCQKLLVEVCRAQPRQTHHVLREPPCEAGGA